MKTFGSFDEWYRGQSDENRRIIYRLRKLVSKVSPKLDEISKWGNGCWAKGDLPLLFIHVGDDHMQFGFFAGALMSDPKKILQGKGKFVRHIRIESLKDIDEKVFSSLIRKAVKAPSYK